METYKYHKPVLLEEMIQYLAPQANDTIIDCTFGAGGYSRKILESNNVKLISFDRDKNVKDCAENLKQDFPNNFTFINDKFSNIDQYLNKNSIEGIVLDLGVSSMQLDEAVRGFSFQQEAKLDMRMGQNNISAYEVINQFPEQKIANILYELGNEHNSRKIAKTIIEERKKKPITTTIELANIITRKKKLAYHYKIHPATKSFQAIRIYVNNELEEIKLLLSKILSILKVGGKVITISFHELEDRIIKEYFKKNTIKKNSISKYSSDQSYSGYYKNLIKKPIKTSEEEKNKNIRSRSAKLRAYVKLYDYL